MVLEESPSVDAPALVQTTLPQILPLSAKSGEALSAMADGLADVLDANDAPRFEDVAFTLQARRMVHGFRNAVVAQTPAEAVSALRGLSKVKAATPDAKRSVIFTFPGQGSQYPGMARGLYEAQPEFARWIDTGAEILKPLLGLDINEILCLGDVSDDVAARALRDTQLTQPALFLTQYANAMLWQSWGVRPDAMIGHSVGEFAAAAVSGVIDFETGLKMIAARGQLMQDQPSGAMLSVRAPIEEVKPFLGKDVDIAALNAPKLQVLAGPDAAIADVEKRLGDAGVACTHLHTSHAFHSQMMDPVMDGLSDEFKKYKFSDPQIPYVSCVTGQWVSSAQATDPKYWASQARATVNFQAAIKTVCEIESPVMVEVGAGRTLSAFAAQTLDRGSHGGIFQSLSDHTQLFGDEMTMATAFSNLWCAGVPVDWSAINSVGAKHISLPGYPFQRKRHWIEPKPSTTHVNEFSVPPAPTVGNLAQVESVPAMTMTPAAPSVDRVERLKVDLISMLSDLSGEDLSISDADVTYLELGFDSLFLGQVSQALLRDYDINLTFRSLLADYPTVEALAAKLDETLPADAAPTPVAPVAEAPCAAISAPAQAAMPVAVPSPTIVQNAPVSGDAVSLMQAQMQTMQSLFTQQLQAIGGAPQLAVQPAITAPANAPEAPAPKLEVAPKEEPSQVKGLLDSHISSDFVAELDRPELI